MNRPPAPEFTLAHLNQLIDSQGDIWAHLDVRAEPWTIRIGEQPANRDGMLFVTNAVLVRNRLADGSSVRQELHIINKFLDFCAFLGAKLGGDTVKMAELLRSGSAGEN